MEPKRSLPHSHVPVTYPYPEPARSSPCPKFPSLKSILIFSCHLYLGLPSRLFPSGFCTITLYTLILSPICSTCTAHLKVLNLITQAILGEHYRSLSSCSFLHSRQHIPLRPKRNTTLSLPKTSINTTPQTYLRVSQIHTLTFHVGGGNSCGGYTLMRVATTHWLMGLW